VGRTCPALSGFSWLHSSARLGSTKASEPRIVSQRGAAQTIVFVTVPDGFFPLESAAVRLPPDGPFGIWP
jgi:hypothetical protein